MGLMVKDLMEDLETGNKTEEYIKNRLTPKPKERIQTITGTWGSSLVGSLGASSGTATSALSTIMQQQMAMQEWEVRRIYEQRIMGGY